jgi:hypothetical protein
MTGELDEKFAITNEDKFNAELENFTMENSFIEDSKDFLTHALLTLASNIDAVVLSEQERKDLQETAITGKLPQDLEITGTLEAWVRNITGETAAEITDTMNTSDY